jgi:hypothetical protein
MRRASPRSGSTLPRENTRRRRADPPSATRTGGAKPPSRTNLPEPGVVGEMAVGVKRPVREPPPRNRPGGSPNVQPARTPQDAPLGPNAELRVDRAPRASSPATRRATSTGGAERGRARPIRVGLCLDRGQPSLHGSAQSPKVAHHRAGMTLRPHRRLAPVVVGTWRTRPGRPRSTPKSVPTVAERRVPAYGKPFGLFATNSRHVRPIRSARPNKSPALPLPGFLRADAGTRTPDPFITSEVLYQLSYVGRLPASVADARGAVPPVGLVSPGVRARGAAGERRSLLQEQVRHDFTVEPAEDARSTIEWVHRILKEERDLVIASRPLEATEFQLENIRMAYVLCESGLSINVMYTLDGPVPKRAVGLKLSGGMDIPPRSPRSASSPARGRSWPGPSAVPTS